MTIGSKAVEISGLRGAAALRARIGERMALALKPIKLEPVSAHIAFFDDNGPKGGGIRCAFTVRLPPARAACRTHGGDGAARLRRRIRRARAAARALPRAGAPGPSSSEEILRRQAALRGIARGGARIRGREAGRASWTPQVFLIV